MGSRAHGWAVAVAVEDGVASRVFHVASCWATLTGQPGAARVGAVGALPARVAARRPAWVQCGVRGLLISLPACLLRPLKALGMLARCCKGICGVPVMCTPSRYWKGHHSCANTHKQPGSESQPEAVGVGVGWCVWM